MISAPLAEGTQANPGNALGQRRVRAFPSGQPVPAIMGVAKPAGLAMAKMDDHLHRLVRIRGSILAHRFTQTPPKATR
jgi:hypothetical protein